MRRDDNYTYYKTKVPYPSRTDFTMVYVTKKGVHIGTWYAAEWAKLTPKPKGTVEKDVNEDKYKAAMKEYHKDQARLNLAFRHDLEREYDVSRDSNPDKADKLYSIAWDYGHSSGHGEVESYYDTLSELVHD